MYIFEISVLSDASFAIVFSHAFKIHRALSILYVCIYV